MFKVQVGKEVRVFQNIEKTESFRQLKEVVRGKFKECPGSFCFTFMDDEGDKITVQSDVDLESFVSLVCQDRERRNLFKLNLEAIQHNQVQQESPKRQTYSQDVDMQSQSQNNLANTEKQSQDDKFQDIQAQQFEEINQFELIDQPQYQSQLEEEQLSRIIKSNLRRIQQQILENTLKQTYNQIIKQEVQTHLQALNSLKYQNEEMFEIEDSDDQQLQKIVEKTLLKQMPAFLTQLTRKTICNVKNMLFDKSIQAPFKQHTKIKILL